MNFANLKISIVIYWIDVCQNDGNLLASAGEDHNIKIYDRRASKIIQTFNEIHTGKNYFIIFGYIPILFNSSLSLLINNLKKC